MINITEYDISSTIHLSIIDIPQIDQVLENLLDKEIVYICEGNSGTDIKTVKKDLVHLFAKKTDDWKIGAIAEFFMHLYIRQKGFIQEFLYRNTEEESIKKGFDGLYCTEHDEFMWLMESKSGFISTKNISHKAKIKEAMNDLCDKVSGKGQTNNPWKNAYNHASNINININTTLREDLNQLKNNFINGVFSDISFFNTIPCGTVFLEGAWQQIAHDVISNDITSIIDTLQGRKILVICATQNSMQMFLDYINKQE